MPVLQLLQLRGHEKRAIYFIVNPKHPRKFITEGATNLGDSGSHGTVENKMIMKKKLKG